MSSKGRVEPTSKSRTAFCPSRRVDPLPAVFPHEILLAVAKILGATGRHKRTLINLLSACRGLFLLGIGELVRRVELHTQAYAYATPRDLDPYRGKLRDHFGTGKLGKIEFLRLDVMFRDPLLAGLLRGAGASLKELEITAWHCDGVRGFLESAKSIERLERVQLRVMSYRDADLGGTDWRATHFDPQADPFMPLLRRINSLGTLKEFSLEDDTFPEVGRRLGSSSVLKTTTIGSWFNAKFETITKLTISQSYAGQLNLNRVCGSFPCLRDLTLDWPQTFMLDSFDFGHLDTLLLDGATLTLPPSSFGRVRAALEASDVELIINPSWYNLEDPEHLGPLEALAEAERWRNEEEFWLGIDGVDFLEYEESSFSVGWERLIRELRDEVFQSGGAVWDAF
ncbi:hypothetical protein DFJ74DRAFT_767827 [Hyaloraphidium curvatum]|nr:hypothetical protein DFJ74DRAFT_767827 [Hyaloraphidium curvatum]